MSDEQGVFIMRLRLPKMKTLDAFKMLWARRESRGKPPSALVSV